MTLQKWNEDRHALDLEMARERAEQDRIRGRANSYHTNLTLIDPDTYKDEDDDINWPAVFGIALLLDALVIGIAWLVLG